MKSNARIKKAPILELEQYTIYWVIKEPDVHCVITKPGELSENGVINSGTAKCRHTDVFEAIFGMKKSLERAASVLPKDDRAGIFNLFGNIYGFGECVEISSIMPKALREHLLKYFKTTTVAV